MATYCISFEKLQENLNFLIILKTVNLMVWAGTFHVCFSAYRGSPGGFHLLQYSSGVV